jgi:hypothetical protein
MVNDTERLARLDDPALDEVCYEPDPGDRLSGQMEGETVLQDTKRTPT